MEFRSYKVNSSIEFDCKRWGLRGWLMYLFRLIYSLLLNFRDNVMIQRRQQMKFRKELEVKVKNEVLEEAETAGDKAKKYNL